MFYPENIGYEEIKTLLLKQLDFFLYKNEGELEKVLQKALERTEKCFSKLTNKYFCRGKEAFFNPFHTGQYAIFLYYLSNTAYNVGYVSLAEKVYCLNKMLHSIDWFYEVELPECFIADHPMGSVLGRAKYGNYMSFSQGVTIGNNHNIYPTFGDRVVLHPNCTVVGNTTIGDNVEISVGVFIRDENIPSNCLVFGESPNLKVVQKSEKYMMERITQFEL